MGYSRLAKSGFEVPVQLIGEAPEPARLNPPVTSNAGLIFHLMNFQGNIKNFFVGVKSMKFRENLVTRCHSVNLTNAVRTQ